MAAFGLVFARWRPGNAARRGKYGWLVRRAESLEGATAQSAAIRWQIICQSAWLEDGRTTVVAWPWENHSWERVFVKTARAKQIRTVGYKHSVIGRQMLNYSAQSCLGGLDDLPDSIICVGSSTRAQLSNWQIPSGRMSIGGALRFPPMPHIRYDASAPIFVALPFDRVVADEMLTAIARCSDIERTFLVRPHPMTPAEVVTGGNIHLADGPLSEHTAVSAVLYAATSVGLEALVAQLPTLRYRPRSGLTLNILPPGIDVPTTDLQSLPDTLMKLQKPLSVDRGAIFAAPDIDNWRSHLKPA